jgi:CRISPR/Cas system type I-B associated protein Csh2 (Cas7 group RAMP superfamily)
MVPCCGNEETRLGRYSLAKWRPRFRCKQTTKLFDVFLKRKRRSYLKKNQKEIISKVTNS